MFRLSLVVLLIVPSVGLAGIKFGTLPTSTVSKSAGGDLLGAGCKIRPDLGSGVNTDAGVLTCLHVVKEAISRGKTVEVDCGGEVVKGTLVYQDPKNDVAILKVSWTKQHPSVSVNSERPKVGNVVRSVARLRDGTIGIESHQITGSSPDGMIVVDNPFIAGSSGGAILNSDGELIGIISGNIVTREPWQGLVIPIRELPKVTARSAKLQFAGQPWFEPGHKQTTKKHLIEDHGYTAEDLDGLTDDQLNRLHGTAHGAAPAYAASAGEIAAAPVYQTICNGRSCRRVRVR